MRCGNFLGAPASGDWRVAAKGELLFIAGCNRAVYDEFTANNGLVTRMGHKHWFVGDMPKHAARAKLVLQITIGTMVGSLA